MNMLIVYDLDDRNYIFSALVAPPPNNTYTKWLYNLPLKKKAVHAYHHLNWWSLLTILIMSSKINSRSEHIRNPLNSWMRFRGGSSPRSQWFLYSLPKNSKTTQFLPLIGVLLLIFNLSVATELQEVEEWKLATVPMWIGSFLCTVSDFCFYSYAGDE